MKIEKVSYDQFIILKVLEKRVDSTITPELKKELLALIYNESPNIIVDLSAVENIDSSGLGALLFGRRQSERFLGKLVLVNAGQKVKKLIEIAHLSRTLMVFDDLREAEKEFGSKS